MEPTEDIVIECVECKTKFTYTKGEQVFMQGLRDDNKIQGTLTAPKRCAECRSKRKVFFAKKTA